jgi:hypothetical protein
MVTRRPDTIKLFYTASGTYDTNGVYSEGTLVERVIKCRIESSPSQTINSHDQQLKVSQVVFIDNAELVGFAIPDSGSCLINGHTYPIAKINRMQTYTEIWV